MSMAEAQPKMDADETQAQPEPKTKAKTDTEARAGAEGRLGVGVEAEIGAGEAGTETEAKLELKAEPKFKSGFVGVLGQTNVGKSTFINTVMGRKVVIVSEKIQTTRNRIRCIYNDPEAQIVFVDTPGLHKPVNKLSRYLLQQAYGALSGLDAIAYMVEPWVEVQEYDRAIFDRLREMDLPVILLINKIDLAKGDEVDRTVENYQKLGLFQELIPISCKEGINIGLAIRTIKKYLPEGPPYFPPEEVTDRPEEFLIAELVREQIFRLTYKEIPYSVAVEVIEIRERERERDREREQGQEQGPGEQPQKPALIEIYANIYVSRDSQKGIIIGRGGQMIREIGRRAREEIERLLGAHVYLDLRVKVREDWVEDERQIARLVGGD